MTRPSLLLLGIEADGRPELGEFMRELPASFPVPIVLVETGNEQSQPLSTFLAGQLTLPLQEIKDKDPIVPGRIYVAPNDYHLLVENGSFCLSTDAPVDGVRPSFAVLCDSARAAYGSLAWATLVGGRPDFAASLSQIRRSVEQEVGS